MSTRSRLRNAEVSSPAGSHKKRSVGGLGKHEADGLNKSQVMTIREAELRSSVGAKAIERRAVEGSEGMERTTRKEDLPSSKDEKLNALAGQVMAMARVFEEAQRMREEQRRLQEERHQDVLMRIQATNNLIQAETKRLMDIIKSFQSKFEFDLSSLREEQKAALEERYEELKGDIKVLDQQIEKCFEELQKEKDERVKAVEDTLGAVQKNVEHLNEGLETERKHRLQKEKEVAQKMREHFDVHRKDLEQERFKLEVMIDKLRDDTTVEQDKLEKRQLKGEQLAALAVQKLREDIEKEADDRGFAQDSIVDNLSSFIQKFQDNIRESG
ncbi:unnamed protein product [Vitrella brassicaformis CCMP3155]|uniref:SF-assemblin n=2 Tax=Vitrella brassicaformis TaxID=1169539 RepID=A0A0G4FDR7_VITBC|nr:unnamed protein product [Vitrella brassicaformis CCMP3155]|eukprot:CEM11104.1 unnamed protein product [Vitrella brassicaformis CCMP3155]